MLPFMTAASKRKPSPFDPMPLDPAGTSSSSSAASERVLKRVKTEADNEPTIKHEDAQDSDLIVKGEELDDKPHLGSRTKLPDGFFYGATKEELGRLLVEAASLSVEFNIRLSDRAREPRTYDDIVAKALSLETHSHYLYVHITAIKDSIFKDSPTETKINALRALLTIITAKCPGRQIGGNRMGGRRYPHLMDPDLDPVRSVLRRLTDRERRESIDAELVRDLDEHVQKRKARQSYGEEGRDVGEKDTADEHMAPPPDCENPPSPTSSVDCEEGDKEHCDRM